LLQFGWTEEQSAAVHIPALVSADDILLGFCGLTSALSYKFSFSSGLTVGQFPNCTKPRPSDREKTFLQKKGPRQL